MNFVQPIRSKAKIDEIERILGQWHQKYRIMFLIGIYSGLRISDVLRLKVKDVYGKDFIEIREKKTGKVRRFRINSILADVLKLHCEGVSDECYLIPGRGRNKPLGARRAYNVIKEAGERAGLQNVGTHSMRKTFGFHYYKQTGDIVMLQKIFNHSSSSITLRYIGIDQELIDECMFNFRFTS